MSLADRIARLEARRPAARPDPFAGGVLDRLSDGEMDELWAMFEPHHPCELADLPVDAQARVMELLDGAKARAVQSANPATAQACGA